MHVLSWDALVAAFAIAAAVSDLRWHRIPRSFNLFGFAIGLLFHAVYGQFLETLQAAFVAFAVGLILFSIGAIGGGDVKLMTALGAMLGLHPWLRAMLFAIFAAAVMSLVQVVGHGLVRQTLRNMGQVLLNLVRGGLVAHPVVNVKNPAMLRTPFGAAAAFGVLVVLLKL